MSKKQPSSIDAHVGGSVRLRRMQIGMSQEKLGDLLGLTFQQIQKYEKGANRIGASRLYEIAHFLGVPVSHFFADAPKLVSENGVRRESGVRMANDKTPSIDDDTGPHLLEFVSSAEGFQLVCAFIKITDPRVRKRMVDLTKSLSGEQPPNPDINVLEQVARTA